MSYSRRIRQGPSDADFEVGPKDERRPLQEILRAEFAASRDYMEHDIAPRRAEALRRYNGDLYGNEIMGRSRVVSTDLRDTVLAVLPSLMGIFTGGEKAVEFEPPGPDDEQSARERTAYINLVIMEDNPGYAILYTAIKEALAQDYAVLKRWHDDAVEITEELYEGQLEDQVSALLASDDVEPVGQPEQDGEADPPADRLQGMPSGPHTMPDGTAMQAPEKIPTFRVRIRRTRPASKTRFDHIPAHEFYISRNARSLDDANLVTHTREITRSDFIAMGYAAKVWDDASAAGGTAFFRENDEYVSRYPERDYSDGSENPDLARSVYFEHYLSFSTEESNGIALLHKVCALGNEQTIVNIESAPEKPFTILCADPEPHKVFGSGFHGLLEQVSKIKSAVLRAVLDSLRATIDPRVAYDVNRIVDPADIQNQELGGMIAVEGDPGTAIQAFTTPFAGREGLGVLDYLDVIIEKRTGQTRGSQGLNPDAMQSTTRAGIVAQLSASQQRILMIARTLKETGVKDLYMGIQRVVMRHQDYPRQVRLIGKWTVVNPATWELPFDVRVNASVGSGPSEERWTYLSGIKQTQELILEKIGPSPIVSFAKYRHTLAKMTEMAGMSDATRFFGEVPEDWAPTPPPPQPDPALQLAQIQLQIEQAKIEQAKLTLFVDTETARMKIEADMQVKVLEIEQKYGTQIDESRVQGEIEAMRLRTDTAIRQYEADRAAQATRAQAASQPPQGQ